MRLIRSLSLMELLKGTFYHHLCGISSYVEIFLEPLQPNLLTQDTKYFLKLYCSLVEALLYEFLNDLFLQTLELLLTLPKYAPSLLILLTLPQVIFFLIVLSLPDHLCLYIASCSS